MVSTELFTELPVSVQRQVLLRDQVIVSLVRGIQGHQLYSIAADPQASLLMMG